MEINDILAILNRRKWVVILTAITLIVVVTIGTQMMPPTYQSTATLRIATASGSYSSYNDYMFADRLINTYVRVATSKPLLDELSKQLGQPIPPKIVVQTIPNTELIQISVEDNDPNLAVKAANTLGSILISQSSEFYSGSGKSPSDILKEQVDQAASELNQDRTNYNNFVLKNPDDQGGIQTAAKTVDLQQQIYSSILSQYEQMRTREAIQANIISVIEPAVFPTYPSKPNKSLNIAMGVAVGLIVGLGLAFLFDNLDTTLFTSKQIREVTHTNPIGQIPATSMKVQNNSSSVRISPIQKVFLRLGIHINRGHNPANSKKDRNNLAVDLNSQFSEAFLRLRTNLLALINDQPIHSLMVTSSLQGEGKSTIAANLAFELSKLGKKIILVDCDLRLPSIAQIFDAQDQMGLSDYLSGEEDLDNVIFKTKFTGLDVIPCGKHTDEVPLLLDSTRMKDIIPALLKEYDLVIIDTPGVLSVTDASLIASLVDGVLLVMKRGFIRKEKLEAALEQIANVKGKIIAFVINQAEYPDRSYQYTQKKNKLKEA